MRSKNRLPCRRCGSFGHIMHHRGFDKDPARSWSTDIKNWRPDRGMAAKATSAADQDLCHELVMITAAQFAPPD